MTINPRKIEFFNRESETAEIKNILKSEPHLITFIYGPINCGKTSLIQKLIDDLPKDKYAVFYINLRGKSVVKYGDFIRVLFAIEEKELLKKIKNIFTKVLKHVASTGEKATYKFTGIPVDKGLLETFFKEKSNEDAFNYLEEYFKNISKHKTPVLIIDELQVIGDLEINGKAIYKLFNFFIRLTKELHICHVFALSSDSLFIEKVYSEAMLQGRARYLFVDDFNSATAKRFLGNYGFSKDEQKIAYDYFGGKPSDLSNLILSSENIKNIINDELKDRSSRLSDMLDKLLYVSPGVMIENEEQRVKRDEIIKLLKKFKDNDEIADRDLSRAEKIYLIKKNIFFIDPRKGMIKPQSKIDLLAIREILGELNTEDYK
ncbi:conserved hypothetical protein [groundwater metagenome]|uniref:AAA+ ATPase domain-containing protein n=1 Tax=groundwater metagenome TaxID=717931 RepID=A0A098E6M5_9ZZZZ